MSFSSFTQEGPKIGGTLRDLILDPLSWGNPRPRKKEFFMYSIIRTKYQKQQQITAVDNHNRRITPQPNVIEGGEFGRVFGDPNRSLVDLVQERLDKLNVEKPTGKMADKTNYAMEFMVTASPEFFENCTPETLEKWKSHQVEWARKKFGGRLVAIDYHNDESASPHFHICTVPVVEVKRKNRQGKKQKARGEKPTYTVKRVLSQSTLYTPKSLEKLCTEYAKSNAQFGLIRGEFRRRNRESVTHTTLKEFRSIVATELPELRKKLNDLTNDLQSLKHEHHLTTELLNTDQNAALDRMADYVQPLARTMKQFLDRAIRATQGTESLDFESVEAEYQKAPKVAQRATEDVFNGISELNRRLKR